MKRFTQFFTVAALSLGILSSCAILEPDEKPIRPSSENSPLAHGASNSSGQGPLGSVLSR